MLGNLTNTVPEKIEECELDVHNFKQPFFSTQTTQHINFVEFKLTFFNDTST